MVDFHNLQEWVDSKSSINIFYFVCLFFKTLFPGLVYLINSSLLSASPHRLGSWTSASPPPIGPRRTAPQDKASQEISFSFRVGPAGLESQPHQIRPRRRGGTRAGTRPRLVCTMRTHIHASIHTFGPHVPSTQHLITTHSNLTPGRSPSGKYFLSWMNLNFFFLVAKTFGCVLLHRLYVRRFSLSVRWRAATLILTGAVSEICNWKFLVAFWDLLKCYCLKCQVCSQYLSLVRTKILLEIYSNLF